MAQVHTKSTPALFDHLIAEIGQGLANKLPFLDNVYGSVERLTIKGANKTNNVPAWPKTGNDYELIAPDDNHLGNMAFFVLEDPMTIANEKYSTAFSLIVWGDMRNLLPIRNIEYAKEAILGALSGIHARSGHFSIEAVYERPEAVFREFSFDESKNKFMMQPYFGLRFTGTLIRDRICL